MLKGVGNTSGVGGGAVGEAGGAGGEGGAGEGVGGLQPRGGRGRGSPAKLA
jgi:hypothetical protein